ncbi:MAG: uracil-DNA glycosylase [Candidatus Muiribacteriota bacterium]
MEIIKNKENDYKDFCEAVKTCAVCKLCSHRKQSVPGSGNINSRIMIVGEGPGAQEDEQGMPFVGKAGQFLTKVLNSVKIERENDVYITNIVKCRPPDNREPHKDEIKCCSPYLFFQIELVSPEIIITLGNPATKFFIDDASGISKMRGRIYDWHGIKIIPMYHPSYLIRNQGGEKYDTLRKETWYDINLVKKNIQNEN